MNLRKLQNLLPGLILLATFPVASVLNSLMGPAHIQICIFRFLSGLDCPFCGLTRAFAAVFDGRFEEVNQFSPFGWLAVLIVAGAATFLLLGQLKVTARIRAAIESLLARPLTIFVALIMVVLLRRLLTSVW